VLGVAAMGGINSLCLDTILVPGRLLFFVSLKQCSQIVQHGHTFPIGIAIAIGIGIEIEIENFS